MQAVDYILLAEFCRLVVASNGGDHRVDKMLKDNDYLRDNPRDVYVAMRMWPNAGRHIEGIMWVILEFGGAKARECESLIAECRVPRVK